MIGKNDIEEAIANGQRNREAIQRVYNWCAHARVHCEARGMLAVQTGLPIGHHSIQCDFAGDDTTASYYEVEMGAVDFHDRNCVGCSHRKPMRLPNISEYIGARDRERALQEAAAAKAVAAAAEALAARDETRRILKARLKPIAQTLVDDIGAFDRDQSDENRERLMRSAQMAPEHFSCDLQEYIFGVCESANWLDAPGLEILSALNADPARLAAFAAKVLAEGGDNVLAASVLVPRLEHLSEEQARNATPAAIDLAAPDRQSFIGRYERPSDATLLHRLYQHHASAVDAALDTLLSRGSTWLAERAGRGIAALLEAYPDAAVKHVRTLISTYVRAEHLLADFSELSNDVYAVRTAVVGAFNSRPAETDALLQDFAGPVGTDSRKRVHELYSRVLSTGSDGEIKLEAARIAFRRLLWATTGDFDSDVTRVAVEAFRHRARYLTSVAQLEIDALLAAPFLLVDQYRKLEKVPLERGNPLAQIERSTDLSYLMTLIGALIGLAAHAAAADPALLPKIGEFLGSIPEDSDILRAEAVEKLVRLADSVAGLDMYLPCLYRAMVGPSSRERAAAATAIGELGQEAIANIPMLVFESFVPLLLDSYLIVHMAAARALRVHSLPESLRMEALSALFDLVRHYRTKRGKDKFLMDCVRKLAGSADAFGGKSSAVRQYLIEACMGAEPMYVRSELRSLMHTLGTEPNFAKLVTRMLPHLVDRHNRSDNAAALVMHLAPEVVRSHQDEFEAVGRELARIDPWLSLVVVDALARSGADVAAARVAKARVDSLDDNPRHHGQRLSGELIELAFAFEAAVGADEQDSITGIAIRWDVIRKDLKARRDEQRERDSRRGLPF